MLVSKKWLSEYVEKLPSANEIAEALTMHSFEIENVEEKNGDDVIDAKILPNRAHDCLCHRGIAKEIAAITGKKFTDRKIETSFKEEAGQNLEIKIDDPKLCRRYIGKRIENVSIKDSPQWLREKLEVLGERSICNIVDITNYIMLDFGQPMHAFDADKIKGAIHVRLAKPEEIITLLTGDEAVLDEKDLVIADDEGPLAIAGIKGGKKAEVTAETKNIILESANFEPISVRKTSQKTNIKNNSSKRFENEIAPEIADASMNYAAQLVSELASDKNTKFFKSADTYPYRKDSCNVDVSLSEISKLLGMKLKGEEVADILDKTGWVWKNIDDKFSVKIPPERLDLTIKEDLVEEIGRIYGYENIESVLPENTLEKPKLNENFVMVQKVRSVLINLGYSEIYSYAFRDKGEVEIENPTATDKRFLRNNLKEGLTESLEMNFKNAPLLGLNEIKVFEIGTVFNKENEKINVAWGIKNKKELKVEEHELENAMKILEKTATFQIGEIFDLPRILNVKFKPISQYPFILRDIAVWTPKGTKENEVLKIILENAGNLLVNKKLFDRFEKDEKVSFAFNLVFQSNEKTLTDSEINGVMEKITAALNSQNSWQVR